MSNILLTTTSSNWTMIVILVVMIALMYFMMIRPQNKEKKRMNEMLSSMAIGDAVLTTAGFYGVIIEITEADVIVEFGNNKNCRIPMRKSSIVQVEKPMGAAPVKAEKEKKVEEAAPVIEETAAQVEEVATEDAAADQENA